MDGSIPRATEVPDDTWKVNFTSQKIILPTVLKLTVEVASDKDRVTVNDMIYNAALDGDGFSVDEFTADGYLNCKMFKKTLTVVVKNKAGEVIGAAILGPSSLPCIHETDQLAVYIIVLKSHKRIGVAKSLGNIGLKFAEQNGFKCILMDAFVTNQGAVGLSQYFRMNILGTLRLCGFLKGQGYTDSLILYKPFYKDDLPMIYSKI